MFAPWKARVLQACRFHDHQDHVLGLRRRSTPHQRGRTVDGRPHEARVELPERPPSDVRQSVLGHVGRHRRDGVSPKRAHPSGDDGQEPQQAQRDGGAPRHQPATDGTPAGSGCSRPTLAPAAAIDEPERRRARPGKQEARHPAHGHLAEIEVAKRDEPLEALLEQVPVAERPGDDEERQVDHREDRHRRDQQVEQHRRRDAELTPARAQDGNPEAGAESEKNQIPRTDGEDAQRTAQGAQRARLVQLGCDPERGERRPQDGDIPGVREMGLVCLKRAAAGSPTFAPL